MTLKPLGGENSRPFKISGIPVTAHNVLSDQHCIRETEKVSWLCTKEMDLEHVVYR